MRNPIAPAINAFFVNCYLSRSPGGASQPDPGDQREVSNIAPTCIGIFGACSGQRDLLHVASYGLLR